MRSRLTLPKSIAPIRPLPSGSAWSHCGAAARYQSTVAKGVAGAGAFGPCDALGVVTTIQITAARLVRRVMTVNFTFYLIAKGMLLTDARISCKSIGGRVWDAVCGCF